MALGLTYGVMLSRHSRTQTADVATIFRRPELEQQPDNYRYRFGTAPRKTVGIRPHDLFAEAFCPALTVQPVSQQSCETNPGV